MAKKLKSTGMAARALMLIMVDPDTGEVVDFANSSVTSTMQVGANVVVGDITWDGLTQKYFRRGTGTADADFVKFVTNLPQFLMDASNTERTIVCLCEAAGSQVRVFGNDSSNYFASQNTSSGGASFPQLTIASNSYTGALTALSAGAKKLFGWNIIRGTSREWFECDDTATSINKGSGALGAVNPSYTLDYVGRRDSESTSQRDYFIVIGIFSGTASDAELGALRDDPAGYLLEPAGGGSSPVESDLSAAFSVIGSAQRDLVASFNIGDAVQSDCTASYALLGAVQQDLAATYNILGPAGVALTHAVDHVLKNNTGTIWASTEFKLSFSRADTDAFVVNKTVSTDAAGLLGVVSDPALSAGVAYDIKFKRTANPLDMGIFTITAD